MANELTRRRRILIADDEPLARDRLRRMLAERPAYDVVAESDDGAAAVDAVAATQPDIVLLDIQMPELDGLAVAEAVQQSGERPMAIIFVTAFDQYALSAFDTGALDYLLKPVSPEKLDRALARAEERLGGPATGVPAELLRFLESLRQTGERPSRFAVRDAKGVYFVRAADIDWVDAEGNYVSLHANGRAHLVRDTMTEFAKRLDPARFVRVHRSIIVNTDRIARMDPHAHGEYVIIMRDGTKLTSSRGYSAKLRELLG